MYSLFEIFLLGLAVGFVSGLFGKGGSAIATPALQLLGVPAFFAVASPLPATIPGTLVAAYAYIREGLFDRKIIKWGISVGVPMTILGAFLSRYVTGESLLRWSDLVIILLGISMLVPPKKTPATNGDAQKSEPANEPKFFAHATVASIVGIISGLLANSGGFLLAPLYYKVLKLPLKKAFSCSLLVATALAIPGTIVHIYLGHISWPIVFSFGAGSIPFSYIGARTAIRLPVKALSVLFGLMLIVIGSWGLVRTF